MKKPFNKESIKLLWEVMTSKNKVMFYFLMFLCLVSSTSLLIPTQVLSVIISRLAGEQAEIFGLKIPDAFGFTEIIIGAFMLVVFVYFIDRLYTTSIEALIEKIVCNLKVKVFDWMITPRKNLDIKMTDGDASYRINEGCKYIIDAQKDLFRKILPKFLSSILALLYLFIFDITVFPIILGAFVLITILILIRIKIEKKITRNVENINSEINSTIINSIVNIPIISLFRSMKYEKELFENKINEQYGYISKRIKVRMLYWNISKIVEYACTYGVILYCALKTFEGSMLAGSIVIVVNYMAKIFEPMEQFGYFSSKLSECSIKLERLRVLEPTDEDTLKITENVTENVDSIKITGISLSNGENFCVKNINLEFKKNESVVIIGNSGCGKSTLLKFLCGLHEKDSGNITINEKKQTDTLYNIIEKTSFVLQNPYMFNRDVMRNIYYPNIEASAKGEEIIENLNLQKVVGRKYEIINKQNLQNMLSGGEQKRISIARGLIKPAEIYLFDEPTNDLDEENTSRVLDEIDKCKKNAMVIIVSHDRRVRERADKIVDLEQMVKVIKRTNV